MNEVSYTKFLYHVALKVSLVGFLIGLWAMIFFSKNIANVLPMMVGMSVGTFVVKDTDDGIIIRIFFGGREKKWEIGMFSFLG